MSSSLVLSSHRSRQKKPFQVSRRPPLDPVPSKVSGIRADQLLKKPVIVLHRKIQKGCSQRFSGFILFYAVMMMMIHMTGRIPIVAVASIVALSIIQILFLAFTPPQQRRRLLLLLLLLLILGLLLQQQLLLQLLLLPLYCYYCYYS